MIMAISEFFHQGVSPSLHLPFPNGQVFLSEALSAKSSLLSPETPGVRLAFFFLHSFQFKD